jgi:hypothetical protein
MSSVEILKTEFSGLVVAFPRSSWVLTQNDRNVRLDAGPYQSLRIPRDINRPAHSEEKDETRDRNSDDTVPHA